MHFSFQTLAKKDDGTYEITVPCFSPTAKQAVTWVQADLGKSALALFKNYNKPAIPGQTYHAVTAQISYTELAELIEKGTMTFLIVTCPKTSERSPSPRQAGQICLSPYRWHGGAR
jgi:hypothetical protein